MFCFIFSVIRFYLVLWAASIKGKIKDVPNTTDTSPMSPHDGCIDKFDQIAKDVSCSLSLLEIIWRSGAEPHHKTLHFLLYAFKCLLSAFFMLAEEGSVSISELFSSQLLLFLKSTVDASVPIPICCHKGLAPRIHRFLLSTFHAQLLVHIEVLPHQMTLACCLQLTSNRLFRNIIILSSKYERNQLT